MLFSIDRKVITLIYSAADLPLQWTQIVPTVLFFINVTDYSLEEDKSILVSNITGFNMYFRSGPLFSFYIYDNYVVGKVVYEIGMEKINVTNTYYMNIGPVYLYSNKESGITFWLKNSYFESNFGYNNTGVADISFRAYNFVFDNVTFVVSEHNEDAKLFGKAVYLDYGSNITFLNCEFYSLKQYEDLDTSYKTLLENFRDRSSKPYSVIRMVNVEPVSFANGSFHNLNTLYFQYFIAVQGYTDMTVTEGTFSENLLKSPIFKIDNSYTNLIILTNSEFKSNYGLNSVFIESQTNTSFSIDNVTFQNNYALNDGGLAIIDLAYIVNITNSAFQNNYANKYALLGVDSIQMITTITNSKFENNHADNGGLFQTFFTTFIVSDLMFVNNYFESSAGIFYANKSSVEITKSNFSNTKYGQYSNVSEALMHVNTYGGVIYSALLSNITISEGNFDNMYSHQGAIIYAMASTNINMSNSTIKNSSSNKLSAAICSQSSSSYDLILDSIIFENNKLESGANDVYVKFTKTQISNSDFIVYQNMPSITLENGSFSMESTTFQSDGQFIDVPKSDIRSTIFAKYLNSFELDNGTFTGFTNSQYGGAIVLNNRLDNESETSSFLITNSVFQFNSAIYGGAIYIAEIDSVYISNTSFIGNTASDKGGAILYSSSQNNELILSSDDYFISNNAAIGGAIYWDSEEPEGITDIILNNNSASIYGDNFACYSQYLAQISEDTYNNNLLTRRMLNFVNFTFDMIEFQQFTSGDTIPNLYFALLDKYNQIVKSDNNSSMSMNLNRSGIPLKFTPNLYGETTSIAKNGMFELSQITFTAEPGVSYNFYLETGGIDYEKPSNQDYYVRANTSESLIYMKIQLRDGANGEILLTNGKGDFCNGPFEYSLMFDESIDSGSRCPTEVAYCNGGSNIGPKHGYWRSSNLTDNFIQGLYDNAGLGMVSPDYNPIGAGANGYIGILGAECDIGYSRSSDYKGEKGPDKILNGFRISLICIFVFIILIVIIKSTLDSALVKKNLQSVYIKILMNHLQLLLIAASFDFKWPTNVDDFFDTSRPVSQASNQLISFDCFIDKRSDEGDSNAIKLYYMKMIMFAVLPFILMIGSIVMWLLIYGVKKSSRKTKMSSKVISSIIILFFLVHPSIVQYMFSNFYGMKIDDENRMMSDLNVIGWGSEHIFYTIFIGTPSIIIWVLGIPFLAYLVLKRNQKDLDTVELRMKYGFLYNGFKKRYYYWESVNMYRKVIIVFVALFIDSFGSLAQALLIFIILVMFLLLNIRNMPYAFNDLNNMEIFSIFVGMGTIYCSLFYISDSSSQSSSTGESGDGAFQLNSATKILFFFIIVVSNTAFFAFWGYKMAGEIKNTLRSKFKIIYLYLCKCGNRKKMEKEIRKREIDDEHDYYCEEIANQIDLIRKLYKDKKLMLNDVVIEKSGLYLSAKNFIQFVQHKSELEMKDQEDEEIPRSKILIIIL